MGSPCQIQCFCQDQPSADRLFSLIRAEITRLEQKYSRYLPNSLLSQINRHAGRNLPIPLDQESQAILQFADQAYELSEGLFDVTSGVLRRVWDFKSGRIPSPAEISALLPLIGWPMVQWQNQQILLPIKGMELDFGGIVKEYAVDRCVALLTQHQVKALVNLGGDIAVTASPPIDYLWQVGVRHPRKGHHDKIASIPLAQGAIAASGDYERFMLINNKRYNHILNPTTGYPIEGLATVCIWAERCVLAGTLTTIAMLKGTAALPWLGELDLPYVAVDHQLKVYGNNK